MNITLYSTGCPRCGVLKKKLQEKNMSFEEITDTDILLTLNIDLVPQLEVDGNVMDFTTAIRWINSQGE